MFITGLQKQRVSNMKTAPKTKHEKAALGRAKRFLAYAGLSDWTAEQNVTK